MFGQTFLLLCCSEVAKYGEKSVYFSFSRKDFIPDQESFWSTPIQRATQQIFVLAFVAESDQALFSL